MIVIQKVVTAYWIVKRTVRKWFDDGAFELAAVLAYYTLISLAPILLIAISVAGVAFGEEAARGQVARHIQRLTGPQGASAIESMIDSTRKSRGSGWAAAISIPLILFGATAAFSEVKTALNRIWGVDKRQRKNGVWAYIKKRLLAFLLVLGVGILLLVLVVVSTAIAAAVNFLPDIAGASEALLFGSDVITSIIVMAVLLAAVYKLLPDCDIAWADVRTGSLVTAVLLTLGQLGIGLYLGYKAVSSAYGAGGSVIVILMGIYYSALIFLLGAEFTNVYATRYGSRGIEQARAAAQTLALEGEFETGSAAVTLQVAPAGRTVSEEDKGVNTGDGEEPDSSPAETKTVKAALTQTL